MIGLCLSLCLSITFQFQSDVASSSIRLTTLKSEWQRGAATVRTMHAKLRRIHYDTSDRIIETSEGTVAFDVHGPCKIALAPARTRAAKVLVRGVAYERRDAQSLTLYWLGDEVVRIDPQRRAYLQLSIESCRRTREEFGDLPVPQPLQHAGGSILMRTLLQSSILAQGLTAALMAPIAMLASPADTLPILLSDPATIETAGFELTATNQHPGGLTAVPTSPATKREFDRIDILFRQDGLPYATNMIAHGGRDNVVHVLDEIRINDLSQAAEAELAPVLEGLQREVWPGCLSGDAAPTP